MSNYRPYKQPFSNDPAIERAREAVTSLEAAEQELAAACIAAHESGWSLNSLASVTGRNFHTVKRMVRGEGRYKAIVETLKA
jgi:hypothetical protein